MTSRGWSELCSNSVFFAAKRWLALFLLLLVSRFRVFIVSAYWQSHVAGYFNHRGFALASKDLAAFKAPVAALWITIAPAANHSWLCTHAFVFP